MNVLHQMEAVTTMQCVQILLAQECALVNLDMQEMGPIVRISMNVWLIMVVAVQMRIVQIQREAEIVDVKLDIKVCVKDSFL